MLKAMDIKNPSRYINDPEEPRELLRAHNEQLNGMVLQLQEQMQMQAQQITQLQAFSETKMIDSQTKLLVAENNSNQKTAEREENSNQFYDKLSQDDKHHNDDIAVDLTTLGVNSGDAAAE